MRIDIVKSKTGRFEFHLSSCSFVIKANPWDAASNLSCGELTGTRLSLSLSLALQMPDLHIG